jgi:transcription initiation factor IIE alpha subunit
LAGLAVWQYSERSAHHIFGDRTGDMLADELLEALKDAGEEGMTRGEIYDYFGRNQRRNRLGAVLRELEEQGLIRREKEKTGERGRPSERWYFCGA